MKTHHTTYIIIGAGLSGLTTGYTLAQAGITDFVMLESRDRIGGRILTKEGIDYGATWFQNHHEAIPQMLEALGIKKFHQRSKGKGILVYNPNGPVHYFESDPNAPSAFRIAGGSAALINGLAQHISEHIHLNTFASEIIKTENGVRVITTQGIFEAEKVIVTIPPNIAKRLTFQPPLPAAVSQAMDTTHTWMSNAIKVGLTFKTPFWREQGLSGTVIGQIGPVTELYDHATMEEDHFCLMGFLNERLRDFPATERKAGILAYLTKHLGAGVKDYLTYEEKDWSIDTHTSSDQVASGYQSPNYGRPEFQSWYLQDTVLFSGAETATLNGGYMDGAVRSGLHAAAQLLHE